MKINKKYGILTEAWSPLGRGSKELEESLIQNIAQKYSDKSKHIIISNLYYDIKVSHKEKDD